MERLVWQVLEDGTIRGPFAAEWGRPAGLDVVSEHYSLRRAEESARRLRRRQALEVEQMRSRSDADVIL